MRRLISQIILLGVCSSHFLHAEATGSALSLSDVYSEWSSTGQVTWVFSGDLKGKTKGEVKLTSWTFHQAASDTAELAPNQANPLTESATNDGFFPLLEQKEREVSSGRINEDYQLDYKFVWVQNLLFMPYLKAGLWTAELEYQYQEINASGLLEEIGKEQFNSDIGWSIGIGVDTIFYQTRKLQVFGVAQYAQSRAGISSVTIAQYEMIDLYEGTTTSIDEGNKVRWTEDLLGGSAINLSYKDVDGDDNGAGNDPIGTFFQNVVPNQASIKKRNLLFGLGVGWRMNFEERLAKGFVMVKYIQSKYQAEFKYQGSSSADNLRIEINNPSNETDRYDYYKLDAGHEVRRSWELKMKDVIVLTTGLTLDIDDDQSISIEYDFLGRIAFAGSFTYRF